MKKLLFVTAGVVLLALTSCNQDKAKNHLASVEQSDSLKQILAQKDTEINYMVGLMNEVCGGFRHINEAENRFTKAKDVVRNNTKQVLRDNNKCIT